MSGLMNRIKSGKGLSPLADGKWEKPKNYKAIYEKEHKERLSIERDRDFLKEENKCLYSKIKCLVIDDSYYSISHNFNKQELYYGLLYTFKLMSEMHRIIRKINSGATLTHSEEDIFDNSTKYLAKALYQDSWGGAYRIDDLINELKTINE